VKEKKTDSVSLKEYLDSKFKELKEYVDIRFSSAEKATSLAQETLTARLESMNEFRESLKDQTASFITRREVDNFQKEIEALKLQQAENKGKASATSVYVAYIIAIAGILLGLFKI
jgi:ribonuclease HII